ncbi:NEW3 domain-containing protein [Sphingobacterium daejeonense]|uniref:NEW3 domain-containing protein n=1 Tax=Sphingobacterium daejeonense TaxID=371142 RepID=A0ABW3RLN6_9SPHI
MFLENPITKSKTKLFTFLTILFIGHSGLAQGQGPTTNKVTEEAAFRSRLMNIEAPRNETFRYQGTLENKKSNSVIYQLQAQLPKGWQANFMVEGTAVRSLEMAAGRTYDINIEVYPSLLAPPGKNKLEILAISPDDTLKLPLEAVVKGSFELGLSTSTGKLNEEVVAGAKKEILLSLKNTGTLPLKDIELTSQSPKDWSLTFDNSQLKELKPNASIAVKGVLQVPKNSISGDYAVKVFAKNANSNSEVSLRIQVTTSLWTGAWGVVIILLSLSLIFWLINKFGRR